MPDFPGCASTEGEIAFPSRVLLASLMESATEMLRPSSEGKGLHPAIRPVPRLNANRNRAVPLRELMPLFIRQSVIHIQVPLCRRLVAVE